MDPTPALPAPDLFSLAGQNVLITGASRGIGAACAVALAEAGADICLVVRPATAHANHATADAVAALGRAVKTVECDLEDLDAVRQIFPKALEAMGGDIHVLVNCAGIQRRSPAVQFPESDWDDLMGWQWEPRRDIQLYLSAVTASVVWWTLPVRRGPCFARLPSSAAGRSPGFVIFGGFCGFWRPAFVGARAVPLPFDAFDFDCGFDFGVVLNVNLKSVWLLSQAAGQHMVARRRGKVINFCSLLTFQGGFTVPAYAAAKGALGQLTKALSNEWSKDNVQVNGICPGYIATEIAPRMPQGFDGAVRFSVMNSRSATKPHIRMRTYAGPAVLCPCQAGIIAAMRATQEGHAWCGCHGEAPAANCLPHTGCRTEHPASRSAYDSILRFLRSTWKGARAVATPSFFAPNEKLLQDPVRLRQISDRIPAGRWGEPRDFAGPVVFLASRASQYVCGELLVVDGGWMGR
ncbi:uncharacterized protein B0H18DRAFT_952125 [Fomitopsis serialis]|uniref:uncharacterized protein n=1 Tax=Fomitopsis serialis TaxID=139415 RepID=UPI002008BECD|nr:uncharacterized protein B0H18DRAFT_952125 [Neoantrodia serialis]KAH9932976.1 hypothetical protein B0H18DRAFT_952125 [Neoantrodia serialis]